MKNLFLLSLFLVTSVFYAQTSGITYQAIIYNPSGEVIPGYNNANSPMANKSVCLQFSIVDAASRTEYQENITTTTDEFGMVNLVIGTGIQTGGYATSFATIYWSVTQKSLKVALDNNGQCSTFVEISNQPFTSVPFAFAANSAENVTGVVSIENGGTNAITVLGAKTNLGLENVDNTSDLNKPISTATQAALNLRENLANKSNSVSTDGTSTTKYPTVKSVKDYVDASATSGTTALTNEATIRANADTALTNNLATEVNNRTNADTTLTNNLATEVTNRTNADLLKEDLVNKSNSVSTDGTSTTKYPTVKSVKDYVDASSTSGTTALSNEATIRANADTALTTDLATEVTNRTNADTALTNNLATEVTNRTNADTALTNTLATEVTNRTNADLLKEDLVNKSNNVTSDGTSTTKYPTVKSVKDYVDASATSGTTALSNEATIRANADTALTTDLATEVTNRTNADTALTNNLATEVTNRTNADTALTNTLATEVTNRTNADLLKEDLVNKSNNVTTDGTSTTKYPTVKSVKDYVDASATSGTSALTNEATIRANADNALTNNLATEVTNRTNADLLKEDSANKSTDVTLADATNTKFPTELAVKTYVDASATSGTTALSNEAIIRANADTALTTNLATEVTNRTNADTALTNNLATEVTNRTNADTALTNTLATEVTNRTNADLLKEDLVNKSNNVTTDGTSTTKYPTVKSVKDYVDASATSGTSALTNEATIRANADTALTTDLATEVTNRTNADTALTNTLATEVTNRTNADLLKEDLVNKSNSVSTDGTSTTKYPTVKSVKDYVDASATSGTSALTNEATIRANADTALTTDLATEVTNRTNADTALTNTLATEVTNRTNADLLKEDLVNKSNSVSTDGTSTTKYPTVKSVKDYVDASATSGTSALLNEATIRANADTALTTDLATEVTNRTNADTALTNNLATEVINRTNADATLQTNINTLTSTVGTNLTNTNSAITAVQADVDANETTANAAIDAKVADAINDATTTVAPSQNAVFDALTLKAPLASPTFTGTVSGIDKTMVGLGNVDNTSDAAKPISTETATALTNKVDKVTGERLINAAEITKLANQSGTNTGDQDLSSFATNSNLALKANIASPTFTGTVSGIDKTMVGLGNVDNTSDAAKPISTETATALTNKVDKVTGERLINAAEITKLANQSGTNTGDQDLSSFATNSNLALKANIASPTFTGTVSGIDKTMVGLANVDNTTDVLKPISTATQTAFDLKANIASPTFTGTVSGIDKTMVGLGNVDNTSDAAKPISTETATALTNKVDKVTGERLINAAEITKLANQSGTNTGDQDLSSFATNSNLALKANIASPTFTGTVSGIDKTMVGLANVDNTTDVLKPISTATQTAFDLKANIASPTFTGTVSGIDKTMVGLGNVDNTSDAAKPISTETATALTNKVDKVTGERLINAAEITKLANQSGTNTGDQDLSSFATNSNLALKANIASPTFTGTVSGIDKTMVGLGNVDNTSDAAKPISTETATALTNKVDKVTGERLINAAEITKLANQSGTNTGDQDLSSFATNSNLALKANIASPTFTGTVSGIDKTMVGLANVDNTTDVLKPISTATQTAFDLKANIASPTFTGTVSGIDKTMVGLGNVDNTSDAAKPISTETATALTNKVDKVTGERLINAAEITKLANQSGTNTGDQDLSSFATNSNLALKANIASPTFTGTVSGIDKTMVGLANVDNTTDVLKPISTATQTAFDLKANIASPTFTGTVSGIDKTMVGLANVDNTTDVLKPISTATQTAFDLKANIASPTFTGTVSGIDKTMVGLGNVDNTSDAAKPISTETATALTNKVDKVTGERLINAAEITKLANQSGTNTGDQDLSSFATNSNLALKANIASPTFTGTVSGIDKTMVGLGNVDNTSDAAKPISTETATALTNKVDKVTGERLINAAEITKLANQSGTNTGDQDLSSFATNSNLALKANIASPTFTGTVSGIDKTMVGLANVDNTTDVLKPISTATQTAFDLKANIASPTFTGTVSGIDKTMVGLGNVDNTSDAAKPISTETATALTNKVDKVTGERLINAAEITKLANQSGTNTGDQDLSSFATNSNLALKANIASPTFTGTVSGIDKTMVGLGNVDNTSDAAKPISTETATALTNKVDKVTGERLINAAEITKLANQSGTNTGDQDLSSFATNSNLALKANIASPTFTGTVSGIDKTMVGLANVDNTTDVLKPISTATQTAFDLKANIASPTFTGTVSGIDKTMVGLGNVDNTSDAAKPISTLTQSALDLKAPLASPTFTGTVSGIDKTMVGLSDVDNTTDLLKPISTLTQTALDLKAPLASPTFTGTPTLPTGTTGVTQTAGDNTTALATTAFVTAANATNAQNFVDLTTAQTVAGAKTFSADLKVNGLTVGKGGGNIDTNSAFGTQALLNNTTGHSNTANGNLALFSNTTGFFNTANGHEALNSNTTGRFNTANGFAALRINTTGFNNTANGGAALLSNTTGTLNTAIGFAADVASGNLTNATAIGFGAIVAASNSIQLGNTSVTAVKTSGAITGASFIKSGGSSSEFLKADGSVDSSTYLTSSGNAATVTTNADLTGVVTSSGNATAIADAALSIAKTNGLQTAIDAKVADEINDATTTVAPSQNAVFDALALKAPLASPTFTGTPTLPTGTTGVTQTAGDNTTALATTAFVTAANATNAQNFVDLTTAQTVAGAKTFSADLKVNGLTVGKGGGNIDTNSAFGTQALLNNTTGHSNTANGNLALFSNTTGFFNTANGHEALNSNTTGRFNTANGFAALRINTTGFNNTANGGAALLSNTTGTLNTAIGFAADVASGNLTNATAIGFGAIVAASNSIQLGNTSVTAVKTSGAITGASFIKSGGSSSEFLKADGSVDSSTYLTSSGNAATVTTNADLTGVVTSSGNATAIADAALSIAKTNGLQTAIDAKVADEINDATTTVAPSQNAVFDALALKAPLASPTFTGTPTLPTGTTGVTQTAGDNTTALATTAFVTAANATNAQNFVDLTTAQTVAGAKTFSADLKVNGLTVGKGGGNIDTNSAFGTQALLNNTTGHSNTANGNLALFSNTTGFFNTANGHEALNSNTTGRFNTANGFAALRINTTGFNNTANGGAALLSNTTGTLNTAIGFAADVASGNLTNATAIGYNAKVAASNSIQLGDTNVTAVKTSGAITGDSFIKSLGTSSQFLKADGTVDSATYITSSGNAATVTTNANLTGVVTSTGNATAIANGAITNAMLANGAVANLSGTNTGDQDLSSFATNTNLDLKAPLASPTFTGDAKAVTATAGDNDESIATTTFVTSAVSTANATNADLTGMVTSNGNATTVVTNADLTGVVTSTGNATAIADGALSIAKTNGLQTAIDSKAPIASPTFTGDAKAVTATAGDNDESIATTTFVTSAVSTANATNADLTGMVTSNGNATTVVTNADLTGVVTSTGNATAIADGALSIAKTNGLQTAIDSKAPLASPTFTGDAKAVTATAGDNDESIATTTFVTSAVSTANATNANLTGMVTSNGNATTVVTNADLTGVVTSTGNATAIADAALSIAKTNGLQTAIDSKATLASPTFTGDAKAVTATAGDNDESIATTTFVTSAVSTANATNANLTGMVTSNGNATTVVTNAALTGVVTSTGNTTAIADGALSIAKTNGLQTAIDYKAPIASPTFTGDAKAVTATAGDNDESIATTAFVTAAASSSNFVDLTTAQTIAGAKTFSADLTVNGLTVGTGAGAISSNTAIGGSALLSNTTGFENTAIGVSALQANTEGNYNSAIGFSALQSNTTGYINTAIGSGSLYSNTEGNYNTANGNSSLPSNTTGNSNTANGFGSLYSNTTGNSNTANGNYSLYSNTTGSNNTAIGNLADVSSDNLSNATAIGSGAIVAASNTIQLGNIYVLDVKTSGTLTAGTITYPNTAGSANQVLITDGSGVASWASPASSGVPYTGATGAVNLGAYDLTVNGLTVGTGAGAISTNTAIGGSALLSNTTGFWNTAIGGSALLSNTTGESNTAIGVGSLNLNTTGFINTAIGVSALEANTEGNFNSAIGFKSLYFNQTGSNNTAIGKDALYKNTAGGNTAIGNSALYRNTTGGNNTAIGYQADVSSGGLSNATAIGSQAKVAASNTIQLGNTAITAVNTSGAITGASFIKSGGSSSEFLKADGSVDSSTYLTSSGNAATVTTNADLTGVVTSTGNATAIADAALSIAKTNGLQTALDTKFSYEVSDEATITVVQTSFTLSNAPGTNSKVKMYINGIRISNTAYTIIGTTLTYIPANNAAYALVVGDRIQFDFSY